MFTGIVEETGTLIASNTSGGNTRFTFQCEKILADVKLGDSIAVNGLSHGEPFFTKHFLHRRDAGNPGKILLHSHQTR